jgi:salicylate hydroxylase
MKVLVAGAGIGGLSAALALLQKGFDVEVFEQAPELREVGGGLLISMNGVRVLQALGLEEEMRSVTLPATDRVVRLWDSGRAWSLYHREPGSKADHSVCMLLRGELHRILAEAVLNQKSGAVRLNARCTGFEQTRDAVKIVLEGGESITGDVLVGADGVHSKVRSAAFGTAEGKYTGAVAWRGLVPMERLSEVHRRPIATTWVGPLAHITCYPMRRRREEIVSFSAQVERSNWELESWFEVGSVTECLSDFPGWHPEVIEMISNAETLYKWGLFTRGALARWTVGRVTLLGDACHPMVPYLGQGAVMALEDSYVLARCLAQYDEPAEALARYDRARRERANRAAQKSADMQATFHHCDLGRADTALEYIQRTWHPDSVKARYDWLFEYDATRVAV